MQRSPQEKKALSYARDCRNAYGENDKSSRKNIPRSKRRVNKANRHAVQQRLGDAAGVVDLDRAEHAEERLRGSRPKSWRKQPDMPLGQFLQLGREIRAAKQRRAARADDPA